jgi:superfamily II DNA or RNA helicase
MAQELIMEGMSVVIFVNFSETVEALCDRLGCDSIDGKQKKNRQDVIDDFVADRTTCVVVNTTAGGEGVSLHDKVGNRPRVSLISPAFSAKDYVQVLGRIHRNGMKSDAIQKILVADGSIEEHVMRSMQKRLSNLKTMQNQ